MRTDLEALWAIGVKAVQGRACVKQAICGKSMTAPNHVIAVGKAAASMAAAAADAFGPVPTVIVTKYHHLADAPPHATVFEAAHPVPDMASLAAGKALVETVAACAPGSQLLMLVSGGASSLAEHLCDGLTLEDIANRTNQLLAEGLDIHAMNTVRREMSQIKAGKLLALFQGCKITTLAISDVQGDDLSVIGSGIGACPTGIGHAFEFDAQIVASNDIARATIAQEIARTGAVLHENSETLYEDIETLAPKIAAKLIASPRGVHLLGGEPTVVLPPDPGKGGRNMALALLLAREIRGHAGIDILVAGTDGTDGPTDAAGARVSGATWDDSGQNAIDTANAAPWLDARGALFRSGPTGTNVMDLLIAERH